MPDQCICAMDSSYFALSTEYVEANASKPITLETRDYSSKTLQDGISGDEAQRMRRRGFERVEIEAGASPPPTDSYLLPSERERGGGRR
jgi:hypothetical protein